MKHTILVFIVYLALSCTAEQEAPEVTQLARDEMIDIRIYADNSVRFNGTMISESSLISHIADLNPVPSTKARIIIDENATSGLVNKVLHSLHRKKITKVHFKALSTEGFKAYLRQMVHIDVLSSGEILYKGNRIYPEDLNTSLRNAKISKETKFILSVSEHALVGPVFDTKTLLADHYPVKKIAFEDPSNYHH